MKVGVAVLVGVRVGVLVGVLVGVFEGLNQAIGFGEPFHTQKKTAIPHRRMAPATPMMMNMLFELRQVGLAGDGACLTEGLTAG